MLLFKKHYAFSHFFSTFWKIYWIIGRCLTGCNSTVLRWTDIRGCRNKHFLLQLKNIRGAFLESSSFAVHERTTEQTSATMFQRRENVSYDIIISQHMKRNGSGVCAGLSGQPPPRVQHLLSWKRCPCSAPLGRQGTPNWICSPILFLFLEISPLFHFFSFLVLFVEYRAQLYVFFFQKVCAFFIDYRYEDRKIGESRGDIGTIRWVLIPSFRKPRSSPQRNKPFSQKTQLKIPLSSRDLKLSISKPGCRVSALHFFVK